MLRLIEASQAGRLAGDVVAVISNRPDAPGLAAATAKGVATTHVDHQMYARREAFDAALAECIDQQRPDWLILAGFMRVLTDNFVKHYQGRMLNLHPSLLPLFPGLHTHRKVLEAGYEEHGSSVHFVTPQLDGGPVLAQARIPVHPHDTEASLKQRLDPIEHDLLESSVGYLLQHRVSLRGQAINIDGQPLRAPLHWHPTPDGPGELLTASMVT
jgi:phosphoribosylglycinamide formyltransferase-1